MAPAPRIADLIAWERWLPRLSRIDDVAWLQRRNQELLDVAAEDRPIDRSLDDARLGQRIDPERSKECERAPAPIGREAKKTLSFWGPTADRRHGGLDPGFIDEDEPCRIEARAHPSPSLAPSGDVGALLLSREERFL